MVSQQVVHGSDRLIIESGRREATEKMRNLIFQGLEIVAVPEATLISRLNKFKYVINIACIVIYYYYYYIH